MGLFVSHCPGCKANIDWFLQAPRNYTCKCGRTVSEKEIEDSYAKLYEEHLRSIGKL